MLQMKKKKTIKLLIHLVKNICIFIHIFMKNVRELYAPRIKYRPFACQTGHSFWPLSSPLLHQCGLLPSSRPYSISPRTNQLDVVAEGVVGKARSRHQTQRHAQPTLPSFGLQFRHRGVELGCTSTATYLPSFRTTSKHHICTRRRKTKLKTYNANKFAYNHLPYLPPLHSCPLCYHSAPPPLPHRSLPLPPPLSSFNIAGGIVFGFASFCFIKHLFFMYLYQLHGELKSKFFQLHDVGTFGLTNQMGPRNFILFFSFSFPLITKHTFGLLGNGNIPIHEHHSAWNTSDLCEQLPSNSMPFRNSPSSASPVPHHIGSAPAVNPSLWEKHAYSPKTSSLHLSSLRSAGFLGSSLQLQSVDFSSQNIFFSQIGGNRMGISALQHSSEHSYQFFPGRDPVARNLSQRRNKANPNNVDKKQFELDIDRLLQGEDKRTMLMIKNIPNKYTSKMLLAAIDEQCQGTYDFLYLPIDFKNNCNVGFAFINMIDPSQIAPCYQKFNSEKVAYLAYARIQGKAALVSHFQNSSLMNKDKWCRPILFHTDGPNAGGPEPFPMGTNIRSRSGRKENHNQGSSSAPASRG
ncbi:hypothetical protein UlMin_027969 [Ulmus minor]